MALAATTVWESQSLASDTLNGGAFDPGQTAGMLTDGAATVATGAAPVFTSASYNFVAGDAGAWIYVPSGTNWIPGWYKIASVAANAATLNATAGQYVVATRKPSTTTGCATVASPTGATWTIDYSQQAAAQITYTDLVSVGTGLTASSAAHPFGKQQVGNALVITGGTNFNTGRYVLASVSGVTGTFVGPTNITTGVGATGAGGLGGALASPGQFAALQATGHICWIKTDGTYPISTASTNVSGGCLSITSSVTIQGYQTVRGDLGTPPTLQAGAISTFTLLTCSAANSLCINLILDGTTKTSSRGISASSSGKFYRIAAINCTNNAFLSATSTNYFTLCRATGCSTQAAFSIVSGHECEAYSNTITGFSAASGGVLSNCLSYANSGASSEGFSASNSSFFINCDAYGNGRDGWRFSANPSVCINCISEANTGIGFNGNSNPVDLFSCGVYNNTGGNSSLTNGSNDFNTPALIVGSASFFVNAAGGNFALNNTSGAGALLRAAGIPGTYLSGTTVGFADIGATQHQDSPNNIFILSD